ncbi:MAG: N-acetylmuramoyl-L-alanine amidase, partial [Leptolyngbyaceae cyanobacterium bins.59]|nr:N-acetylmuramoyl-L-alanine amidase [Leptolyngbyaceae cyanobacterium bins.59]
MGRIFISAGHGGAENGRRDPGAVVGGTDEAKEMMLTRDLVVADLRSRNFEVLSVPDDLSLRQTISWINSRVQRGDVALEIHADAAGNPTVRGSSVFYISNNNERKAHAELLLMALLRRVPQLPSRGAKPDTATGVGSLGFCRQVQVPSLLMEVGFLTSPDDRFILQNRRRDIAAGIADGLAAWSRAISGTAPPPPSTPQTPSPQTPPPPTPQTPATPPTGTGINITVNGQ